MRNLRHRVNYSGFIMKEDYIERIFSAYQGEVEGEAFFNAMSELLDDRERSYKMRVLAQLELETKERLIPHVEKLGGTPNEDPRVQERGIQDAVVYSKMSWENLMTSFKDELLDYITQFKELEGMGREEDMDVLEQLTKHEDALLSFVERELAGQSNQSLEPVVELLEKVPSRV